MADEHIHTERIFLDTKIVRRELCKPFFSIIVNKIGIENVKSLVLNFARILSFRYIYRENMEEYRSHSDRFEIFAAENKNVSNTKMNYRAISLLSV